MKKSSQIPDSAADSAIKPNHNRGCAHVTHQAVAIQKRFAMMKTANGKESRRLCRRELFFMTIPQKIGTASAIGAKFSGGIAM
jgi:hypothetical protein